MFRRFRRHKLGILGAIVLIVIGIPCCFAEFFAPYGPNDRIGPPGMPPQKIYFIDETGRLCLPPIVYGAKITFDMATGKQTFAKDLDRKFELKLFVRGRPYRLGPWLLTIHLYGVQGDGYVALLGTDKLGRDLLSRILYGGRITLGVTLFGVLLSVTMGVLIGLISGYSGGWVDLLIQRAVELLKSFPPLPVWMAISAAIPANLPVTTRLAALALTLAVLGWAELARQVRGKVLVLRTLDFVQAAQAIGASTRRILLKHLVPNLVSHITVVATLLLPTMIIAESTLSFLGLGVEPPMTSWGRLLRDAQNVRVLASMPWLLIPGILIIIVVLGFNFVGDAIRDAADPHNIETRGRKR